MENKIYLNGQFGFREDTLENWVSENPVLERGEPAVIRDGGDGEWLKIGDGITAFNDLPYKKGPRGEKGEQGEKGADGKDAVTDLTYSPKSENAQSGIAVADALTKALQGVVSGDQLKQVVGQATELVTTELTKVWNELGSLNDQRFAVYYTDKVLQKTPKDQWLTFKQAYYACGYGGVTYGEGTYDNRPKIGDMLICRPNGYIYKVAGVQEKSQTICAWFIASGTGNKEYAEKSYVDEKIATAGGGTANYTLIGNIDLNNGSIDISGQYTDILIMHSPGVMYGYADMYIEFNNNDERQAQFEFDFGLSTYKRIIYDGGFFNVVSGEDGVDKSVLMSGAEIMLNNSIKKIRIEGYPIEPPGYEGMGAQPFETAQVYARYKGGV